MRNFVCLFLFLFVTVPSAFADLCTDVFSFREESYGLERVAYSSEEGYVDTGTFFSKGLVDVVLTSEVRSGFCLTERGLSISPYPKNVVHVSAGGRNITSVVLEMYSSNARFAVNGDEMSVYTMKRITLPVDAAQCDIDFNLTSRNSIVSMSVTYDGTVTELRDAELRFSADECYVAVGNDCVPPVLSKATDAAVSFTSSDTGVATVDAASGAIKARRPGTAVITAHCDATSVFAAGEASYSLVVIDSYADLGAVLGTADGTLCSVGFPLTAVYSVGEDTYVVYGPTAAVIRDAGFYAPGDVIPAGWIVRHGVVHGLDVLTPYGGVPAAAGKDAVDVRRVEAVDLSMVNSIVVLEDVIFADSTPAPGNKEYFTGECGSRSYTFVNEYGVVPGVDAGVYDVQLVVSCYDGYLRLYPLEFMQGVSVVPVFSGTGVFKVSTDVSLVAADGAEIYYSDNPGDSLSQFSQYTGPLHITATTTLRAYAREWGKLPSEVVSATFTRQDSGIEDIPDEVECLPSRYFTLQGEELPAPPAEGVYIEISAGRSRKVMR